MQPGWWGSLRPVAERTLRALSAQEGPSARRSPGGTPLTCTKDALADSSAFLQLVMTQRRGEPLGSIEAPARGCRLGGCPLGSPRKSAGREKAIGSDQSPIHGRRTPGALTIRPFRIRPCFLWSFLSLGSRRTSFRFSDRARVETHHVRAGRFPGGRWQESSRSKWGQGGTQFWALGGGVEQGPSLKGDSEPPRYPGGQRQLHSGRRPLLRGQWPRPGGRACQGLVPS